MTKLPLSQCVLMGVAIVSVLATARLVAGPVTVGTSAVMNEASFAAWDNPSQPIGPNHRTTLPLLLSDAGHQTVEVATGMNYWNGQAWVPSNPTFGPSTNGFAALQVQHPVQLAGDLYTEGAVTELTPDGITLKSSVIGIALYDAASGESVIVATVTNCAATQIASNQVLYADAIQGSVCASILYTITKDSFQQDVILTGNLDPATFGFPRATTRIEILTEFYNPPVPDVITRPIYVEQDEKVRNSMVSPDFVDHQLGFGRCVMNLGYAYIATPGLDAIGSEALVAKDFTTSDDNRHFLVESVGYPAISNALQSLPPCQSSAGASIKPTFGFASVPRIHPGRAKTAHVRVAQNASVKGLVIDYIMSIGGSLTGTIIFKGDTTYLVSSAVGCNGPTLVEGGVVFKYKSNTSITLNNTLTCKTGSYRPAIFTGVDDNLVGDTMNGVTNSGYTGTISTSGYANPAISMGYGINLNLINFRFCYAKEAIKASITAPTTWSVTHSQFINCIKGIEMVVAAGSGSGSGTGYGTFRVNNCLLSQVGTAFISTGGGTGPINYVYLYNSTLDHVTNMASSTSGATTTIRSTNSVFANIVNTFTASGINNGFYSSASTFGNPYYTVATSPFQSVGAGEYYLTSDSGFPSDATTTSMPASLQTDLQKRTVYPPLVLTPGLITVSTTLSPQAARDISNNAIGYHYDPLDYAAGDIYVTNSTLTLTPGTAIATFSTNSSSYGLGIGQGATFSSQGTASTPNWIALYTSVMESTNGNWQRPTNSVTGELYGLSPSPTIGARFTFWSCPAQDAVQFYAPTNTGPITFQDSEFHCGQVATLSPTLDLTNCLLERTYANLSSTDGNSPYIRNNLFYGGTFNFAPNVTNSFVKDNLFDQTSIPTNTSIYTTYNGGYNAFDTNQNRLLPTFTNDIVLTSSPAYQIGPLGFYYQTNSSVLIDQGDTTADLVELYHYTVRTNLVSGYEIKETNSVVDIGYHYVATDQNGNPIDTDGDGIPDYLEDANGNGLVDSGETDWTSATDLGLKVIISRPKNNSIIP